VQQIAWVDTETGECGERRLTHLAEAEQFYRELRKQVRVGIEATGHSRWFERLLAELNYEIWIGDPAQIRAKQVRKQKAGCRAYSESAVQPEEGAGNRAGCSGLERKDVRGHGAGGNWPGTRMRLARM
jgi:transposase